MLYIVEQIFKIYPQLHTHFKYWISFTIILGTCCHLVVLDSFGSQNSSISQTSMPFEKHSAVKLG